MSSIFHSAGATVSSSFLPLLAFELSCVFASHGVSAEISLVQLPRWLPHCTVPEPRSPFPFIQSAPKERRGQPCLSAALGIGYVLALGHGQVRDTKLGTECHIFCFCFPDIPQLFLASTILTQSLFHISTVPSVVPWQVYLRALPGGAMQL